MSQRYLLRGSRGLLRNGHDDFAVSIDKHIPLVYD